MCCGETLARNSAQREMSITASSLGVLRTVLCLLRGRFALPAEPQVSHSPSCEDIACPLRSERSPLEQGQRWYSVCCYLAMIGTKTAHGEAPRSHAALHIHNPELGSCRGMEC
jgi:hypothetical protein